MGIAVGLLLAVALLLADGAARPAAAETPAGETESFVTSVEPQTDPIAIRVLGGDETTPDLSDDEASQDGFANEHRGEVASAGQP